MIPEPLPVTLWAIPLDQPPAVCTFLAGSLSRAELARAASFRFDQHRRRFIVRRGALRHILAAAAESSAASLAFTHNTYGRPQLVGAHAPGFSLSHSHELALLALADATHVGVDVERIRSLADRAALAASILSAAEQQAYAQHPQPDVALFRAWTQKEAFVKALGRGLSFEPARVSVKLDPAPFDQLLAIDDDALAAAAWSVAMLQPAPGYIAAVVAHAPGVSIHLQQWSAP